MQSKRWTLALFAVLGSSLLIASPLQAKSKWKVISKKNGITVSQKEVPERGMPIFRGQTTIKTSIYNVMAVLADFSRHTEWMHACHTAKILKKISPSHIISYNRSDAPWPVSDRDVVMRTKVKIQEEKHTVLIRLSNITSPMKPPVDGVVRMPRMIGSFTLKALGPDKTFVAYQIDADPGGSLPEWLAKLASEDLPYGTLDGLRKRAVKPWVQKEYTEFFNYWNPKYPNIIPGSKKTHDIKAAKSQ